jgi:hypothetical protein
MEDGVRYPMTVLIALTLDAHITFAQSASAPECTKAMDCCEGALKIDPSFFSGPTYCDSAAVARYQTAKPASACTDVLAGIRYQLGLSARALPDACAVVPQQPPDGWWTATETNALLPTGVAVRFRVGEIEYGGAYEDRVAGSLQPVATGRWQLYGMSTGVFELRRLARDRLSLSGPDGTITLRAVPVRQAQSLSERARMLPDPWQSCDALAVCCHGDMPDARASLSCRTAALAAVTTRPSTTRCQQMRAALADWYQNQKKLPPECATANR